MDAPLIGIDLGATNLLVGAVDEDGQVIDRSHRSSNRERGFDGVLDAVCAAVAEFETPAAIGIAVAGCVDVETGMVVRAYNLDWTHEPLGPALQDRLGCPVVIENDVTAAAWGEHCHGAGRGVGSLFAAWVGSGIGGGLVLDGAPWRGPLGTAGEFGMTVSDPCGDDGRRLVEDFGGRIGMQRVLGEDSTTQEMAAAFAAGGDRISSVIGEGAAHLGTAIANVVTLLGIDLVVLGGGLVEAMGDPFVAIVRERFEQDVFPPDNTRCRFALTELGPNAGILGAAELARTAS